MYFQMSAVGSTIFIVACILGLYYWLLNRYGILKPKGAQVTPLDNNITNNDIIPRQVLIKSETPKMDLPPATGNTVNHEPEEDNDETGVEIMDHTDSLLLKEAEKVVDQIQDTIVHIASNPPNPEEVTTKIKAIISPYKLFLETEYYDSINTYIALTLERDCGIILSHEQLQSLWN